MKSLKFLSLILLLAFTTEAFSKGSQKLIIADRKVNCPGDEDKDCIQVKQNSKDPWICYFDSIQGFSYEEGYEYKLEVEVLNPDKKIKDLQRLKYKLIKVVSATKTGYNPIEKLQGKKWILLSMFDNGRTIDLQDTTVAVHFDIKEGKLTGHGVCNTFVGKVKGDTKTIAIDQISFTKVKCVDQGNIFETIIANLLKGSTSWTLKGKDLLFDSPSGTRMAFKKGADK